jgi:hypothetical protein
MGHRLALLLAIPAVSARVIVRAKASNTARFGRIDRSNLESIDFGVVGPTRASVDSAAPNSQEERENQQTIDCRLRLEPWEGGQARKNTRRRA